MNSFAFINISKEVWANPRRARKQLLFEALLRQPFVEEVFYVDPHRHFWQPRSETAPTMSDMHVWQGTLLLPGERFRFVRIVNRWYIYYSLLKVLKHRIQWYTIFYNPWDVRLARYLLNQGKVLFDWTEDWAEYHSNPAMLSAQEEAVKMAFGVIVVTESLADRATKLRKSDKKILLLPNASAWRLIQNVPCPDDMVHVPFPRIGYIGHLGPWFDKNLVIQLLKLRPDWHWVMIGHFDQNYRNCFKSYPNVHLLGQRPFNTLQAYMAQCQVLVAPYRKNIEVDSTKIYDYLTLGLPIVSTDILTARRLEPHVHVASGLQSWLYHLDDALQEKDEVLSRARQEESQKHTWDARATKLLDWLQEL